MERELWPHVHAVPDSEPVLDVSPISVRYHIRSFREFEDLAGRVYGQYMTNTGNFGVSFGQDETMASQQDASTSGHRPGKEHVEDDNVIVTANIQKVTLSSRDHKVMGVMAIALAMRMSKQTDMTTPVPTAIILPQLN